MKIFIIGILAIAIVAVGLFFWGESAALTAKDIAAGLGAKVVPQPQSAPLDPDAIADASPPPPGFVRYRNDQYGFSFYHSGNGVIKEYDEGQGAMTIVLENEEKMRGLQIFVVPYKEETISEERFLADVPSGVRLNVEETTIGSRKIPAVTFNSFDEALGETREIWFIDRGYLYELTTFKGVGDWLTPILQSWRFLYYQ